LIKYLKVTTDDIIPELVWNYKPQGRLLLGRRSKVNVPLRHTGAKGKGYKYSSYSFLTSAFDGGEWSA